MSCRVASGDLILFRTNSTAASITRWFTDAPFDHVAMILRTSEGYRTVECTGQGIGCWILQERVDDWIIKGVVIRRLKTQLTNEMVNNLNAFLQSVKHKPYRMNGRLIKRMARTCLCCQRVGQNERGLGGDGGEEDEDWCDERGCPVEEEMQQSIPPSAAKRYATENGEDGNFQLQDGQSPIPSLLPPLDHQNEASQPSPSSSSDPNRSAISTLPSTVLTSAPSGSSSSSSATTSVPPSSVANPTNSTSSLASSSSSSSSSPSPSASPSSPHSVKPPNRPHPRPSQSTNTKLRIELKDHESIRSHYPNSEDISQLHLKKHFFCSSFIAACYMKMGLLPSYPPIDWYLPNTFSARAAIQAPLIDAEFGDEILIEKPSKDTNKKKWTRVWKEDQHKRHQQRDRRLRQERQTQSQSPADEHKESDVGDFQPPSRRLTSTEEAKLASHRDKLQREQQQDQQQNQNAAHTSEVSLKKSTPRSTSPRQQPSSPPPAVASLKSRQSSAAAAASAEKNDFDHHIRSSTAHHQTKTSPHSSHTHLGDEYDHIRPSPILASESAPPPMIHADPLDDMKPSPSSSDSSSSSSLETSNHFHSPLPNIPTSPSLSLDNRRRVERGSTTVHTPTMVNQKN